MRQFVECGGTLARMRHDGGEVFLAFQLLAITA